ncbi:hypothetical protein HNQ80_003348 [Anaerosolibacter carboniphilus]|uniref:Uncharacterized protein n=1 Tax=Anaerosolibacter carboniphilus TaxID=1417629 RepID=A0A841L4B5_9FIRM|nr:hypothetical protein [Anaerosolibacter carboniphilus]MBB6217229.1 hypothetical protein [Anaerosolibacter carboniphilus]
MSHTQIGGGPTVVTVGDVFIGFGVTSLRDPNNYERSYVGTARD